MTTLDIVYLAGFVDGEGTIGINRNGIKKNGEKRLLLCLSICNTNKAIIFDIRKFFSCGTITIDKRTIRKTPLWKWRTEGIKAKQAIKSLYPFLRIKKQHAFIALNFPLAQSGALGVTGYSNPDVKKRHEIYETLKELNRR